MFWKVEFNGKTFSGPSPDTFLPALNSELKSVGHKDLTKHELYVIANLDIRYVKSARLNNLAKVMKVYRYKLNTAKEKNEFLCEVLPTLIK